MSCGEGRAGQVRSGRASRRGRRAVALADPRGKRGGREQARAAGWTLARVRGHAQVRSATGYTPSTARGECGQPVGVQARATGRARAWVAGWGTTTTSDGCGRSTASGAQ